jgi:hypothetical protein
VFSKVGEQRDVDTCRGDDLHAEEIYPLTGKERQETGESPTNNMLRNPYWTPNAIRMIQSRKLYVVRIGEIRKTYNFLIKNHDHL